MKREAINEAEATLNEDILYPALDTMLECRKLALEKVNAMYGTDITVEFDSVWFQNKKQEDLALDLKEAEIENMEQEPKENEVSEDESNRESNV